MGVGELVFRYKSHLVKQGRKGLVAYDVDDTLVRTAEDLIGKLTRIFGEPDVGIEEIKSTFFSHGELVGWNGNKKDVLEWIQGEYQQPGGGHEDAEVIEGMREITLASYKADKCFGYITARGKQLEEETRKQMARLNFPEMNYVLKPLRVSEPGGIWKGRVMRVLFPHVSGIVENDARICRYLEENDYEGDAILFGFTQAEYEATKKPGARSTGRIHCAKTVADVGSKVQELFLS